MASLADLIATHIGRKVTYPGGLGGQCVDLVEVWAAALGKRAIPGNAVDLLSRANTRDWRVVHNAPTNAPGAGSIVVWGYAPLVGVGYYGHTAISLAADAIHLVTFDQS